MDSILFSGVNPQDFKKEILDELKSFLQELKFPQKEEQTSDLLTRQQVAEMLSIDLSTVHNWTKQGKLISYGIGNRVYYKSSEVEDAIVRLN